MRKFLAGLGILSLVLLLAAPVLAAETSGVTATVTPQFVAVSISDGVVNYGTLAPGGSQDTVALPDTQVVKNDGNVSQDFNIRGQDSTSWTLGTIAGTETYRHEFSTSAIFPGTALTTTNQPLSTGVASLGTVNLDLKITIPTTTAATTEQSVDVTVVATASL